MRMYVGIGSKKYNSYGSCYKSPLYYFDEIPKEIREYDQKYLGSGSYHSKDNPYECFKDSVMELAKKLNVNIKREDIHHGMTLKIGNVFGDDFEDYLFVSYGAG